ncbi:DUF4192 family protein [Kitasatospora sp. NPDC096147]|uniref:DUF4192 domain-containing protein n=1 Tax=Kitasatospora sp. NPDC096147 TaxID=3364093 RepID=UPI0037FF1296
MNNEEHVIQSATSPAGQYPLRMRGPADMAEMLPYLLGFFPDDSIVAVGLQGPMLQQGGVIRLDIPADPAVWPAVAADTARLLVGLSEQRDQRPEQVLIYLCRDVEDPADPAGRGTGPAGPTAAHRPGSGPPPSPLVLPRGAPGFDRVWPPGADRGQPADAGGSGRGAPPDGPSAEPVDGPGVVALLRPLADLLAQEFRAAGVAVKESLCVSDGRWWSFLCGEAGCCDPEGVPIRSIRLPSPIAAAAAYAGVAPRGSRKAIAAGLAPIGPPGEDVHREALELAGPELIGELAGPGGRFATLEQTAELLAGALADFGGGARELDPARTARLLVGLQDKLARDRGAEYAEPDELVPAQRLWRYLARRCVPPFERYAAPPLTLLAWTSWLAGDTATARVVLARVLDLDQTYTLAQLLYESLNGGLHPGELLDRVRAEREARRQVDALHRPGVGTPPGTGARAGAGPADPGEGTEPREGHGAAGPDGPSVPLGEGPPRAGQGQGQGQGRQGGRGAARPGDPPGSGGGEPGRAGPGQGEAGGGRRPAPGAPSVRPGGSSPDGGADVLDDPSASRGDRPSPPPSGDQGPEHGEGGGRRGGGPGASAGAARRRGGRGSRGRAGRGGYGGAAPVPEPGDEPPGGRRTARRQPRSARRGGRLQGERPPGGDPGFGDEPAGSGRTHPEPARRTRRAGRPG